MDRTLVIDERTELVAKTITQYLQRTDPMAKTIVFCNDIDHAERMRRALVNLNPEQVAKNDKYIMKITGDDEIGKGQLDNFINPEERYPVIATTSKLMTTGVDAQTCKLIVLDQHIKSMTEFKQIIGRGTRINEDHGKYWFTIMDFKKATELFADPAFDGDPVDLAGEEGRRPQHVQQHHERPDAADGEEVGDEEPGDEREHRPRMTPLAEGESAGRDRENQRPPVAISLRESPLIRCPTAGASGTGFSRWG